MVVAASAGGGGGGGGDSFSILTSGCTVFFSPGFSVYFFFFCCSRRSLEDRYRCRRGGRGRRGRREFRNLISNEFPTVNQSSNSRHLGRVTIPSASNKTHIKVLPFDLRRFYCLVLALCYLQLFINPSYVRYPQRTHAPTRFTLSWVPPHLPGPSAWIRTCCSMGRPSLFSSPSLSLPPATLHPTSASLRCASLALFFLLKMAATVSLLHHHRRRHRHHHHLLHSFLMPPSLSRERE